MIFTSQMRQKKISKIAIESAYLAQTIMTLFYFHPWHQHNNGDAFRHCLWSSIIAKRTNSDWAFQWTNARESKQFIDNKMRMMDEYNNSKGIELLNENSGYKVSDLILRCSELVARGTLRKLTNNKLVPTTSEGFSVPSIFEVISKKVDEVIEFISDYFKEKVGECDADQNSALHRCIMDDYEYGFNILVSIMDINRTGNSGLTPLMICSTCTHGYKYAEKLIAHGANADYQEENYGETALMKAAIYDN